VRNSSSSQSDPPSNQSRTSPTIRLQGLGKCYRLFRNPRDRLKQALWPGSRRYYDEFWALRSIDLAIQAGETVGIVGRNGSGKSTLLQLICETVTATEGTVSVAGRIAALLELGAGFNHEFSGHDNIYLNGGLLGLSEAEIHARYAAIIAFADIGDFIHQSVKTYSSGMVVRLAFAIAAHVDADILIIDEALAVGDAYFTQKCMRFLRDFRERGGTLLFVSHDMGAVANLCDRAVLLEKGRATLIGSAKDVCERYLQTLYDELRPRRHDDSNAATTAAAAVATDTDVATAMPFADSTAFGVGGARITSVRVVDRLGEPIRLAAGGDDVRVIIEARCDAELFNPMLGFLVKDRLGQYLFGENTYATSLGRPLMTRVGDRLIAEFRFTLPYLADGDIIIAAAVAEGTQTQHVQHHWVHDAYVLKVKTDATPQGLFHIPMERITLELAPRSGG
jgi:lipopolysaccharide transport system ATP-binding protein